MSEPRRRILIVDDEEDLVDMLALRLEATGLFSVSKAHDGASGLKLALELAPDVVLLDGLMPEMTGWELCRRLREHPAGRACAVVMMTAGAPEESKKRAREHCLDGLILKPYDQAQIIEVLKETCRART